MIAINCFYLIWHTNNFRNTLLFELQGNRTTVFLSCFIQLEMFVTKFQPKWFCFALTQIFVNVHYKLEYFSTCNLNFICTFVLSDLSCISKKILINVEVPNQLSFE